MSQCLKVFYQTFLGVVTEHKELHASVKSYLNLLQPATTMLAKRARKSLAALAPSVPAHKKPMNNPTKALIKQQYTDLIRVSQNTFDITNVLEERLTALIH